MLRISLTVMLMLAAVVEAVDVVVLRAAVVAVQPVVLRAAEANKFVSKMDLIMC